MLGVVLDCSSWRDWPRVRWPPEPSVRPRRARHRLRRPLAPTPTPSPTPTPTPSPTPTPTPTPTPSPTPTPTPELFPSALTGRMISEKASQRHPIAVMIDDLSPARPQSGLQSASIVWHAPAEGGIPRYMAIFADTLPEDVGPVRSARLYFVQWASEWKAVYVHAGGSPQALATLATKGHGQLVYNADEFRYAAYFRRIPDRFAPHNLYSSLANLRKLSAAVGAKPGPLEAEVEVRPGHPPRAAAGGRLDHGVLPGEHDHLPLQPEGEHVPPLGQRRGRRSVDASSGKRIAPKNVIVMLVNFSPLNDGSHKNRQEADIIGNGKAWIATNGTNDQGHLEEEQDQRADPVLRRRRQARSR